MEPAKKEEAVKKEDSPKKAEANSKKKKTVIPNYSTIFHGKIAFGKYPSDEEIAAFVAKGYSVVVNLVPDEEAKKRKIGYDISKHTSVEYIHFPIDENKGPATPIVDLIKKCVDHLSKDKKIYIHCMNGRGRTGVIGACIVGTYLDVGADLALGIMNEGHRRGHGGYKKWFRHSIPSHRAQMEFVFAFLDGEEADDEDE
jgi:protein-tyrosine phosphatase